MPGASFSAKEYLGLRETERLESMSADDREMERLRAKGETLSEHAQASGNRSGTVKVDDTTLTLRGQLSESDFREGREGELMATDLDDRTVDELKADLVRHGDGWGS